MKVVSALATKKHHHNKLHSQSQRRSSRGQIFQNWFRENYPNQLFSGLPPYRQESAIRTFLKTYPLENRQPELPILDLKVAPQTAPLEDDQLIQEWLLSMGFEVSYPTGNLVNDNAIAAAYYALEE